MAILARGYRCMFLSFDQTDWTLIGKKMDSLETSLNPEIENGKDVTGASYSEHKGFSPETDITYKCDPDDAIYDSIQEITDELKKDEASTTAYMVVATLNEGEVKDFTDTALTGTGYKVPVTIVPQTDGGDTGAYQIAFNAYENGARTKGTVAIAKTTGALTFTPAS